ncbi:hypothetical protein L3Q82_001934 [Scortum barcoo]|uniref:Uncharacterized protein n=1 Tax=Scortum barcoo TaxID=214431 RepID=A0ACB8W0U5_9TELE|nr:hypothetical protein L3Q82_001934 [Scortum barcoo]
MPREHCPLTSSLSLHGCGPAFLRDSRQSQTQGVPFDLVDPDTDPELRPEVMTCTTTLLEGRHHVTELIVRHFHEKVCHQGRHFTEGAVRAAGFWIVGGKRAVSSTIFNCVTCRRLRGKEEEQIMADLPKDRLCSDPPFTYVGLDVFGPWPITARKTRGGHAETKRWAVIFVCMSIRAIHIEIIESMDTSSFINALRRFFAIRGAAKLLRSDCGTNFVSACKELQIDKRGCHNKNIDTYLEDNSCQWQFNPPHASHMAGSWERMIGVARRILNAMLLQHGRAKLTHKVTPEVSMELVHNFTERTYSLSQADQWIDECPYFEGTFITNDTDVEDFVKKIQDKVKSVDPDLDACPSPDAPQPEPQIPDAPWADPPPTRPRSRPLQVTQTQDQET